MRGAAGQRGPGKESAKTKPRPPLMMARTDEDAAEPDVDVAEEEDAGEAVVEEVVYGLG